MKKKLAILLTVFLFLTLLAGCGAEAGDKAAAEGLPNADVEAPAENNDLYSTTAGSGVPALENQKLVRKVRLNAETEDLDALLSTVDGKIRELSGYVEKREIYNGSEYSGRRNRNADMTIRIPVDQLDAFLTLVKENANITSTNETVDNITLSYVATQSRITALETEQTRLLELLAKAESMEDLLKIEERLTQVRTQLEEVTSQLRVYDNMVDYGTVYLYITEVREYTVVEEPDSIWERMGTGFVNSVKNVWHIIKEVCVFIVVAAPYLAVPVLLVLLPVIVILVLVKLVLYKLKKGRKNK